MQETGFCKRKRIVKLFLVLLCVSCQGGAQLNELCCDYVLLDRGAISKSIIRKNGTLMEGVLANIEKYTYNSSFILILQKPNYHEYLNDLAFSIRSKDTSLFENDSKARAISKVIADSLLKHDKDFRKIFYEKYNLWIITKDKIYGPMNLNEYYIKRQELRVPKGLYLEI